MTALLSGGFMKAKDFIKEIEKYTKTYGEDIEIIVSADPEGNSYGTTHQGSFGLIIDNPNDGPMKPVGLCIYPWDEHFQTPESACYNRKFEWGTNNV